MPDPLEPLITLTTDLYRSHAPHVVSIRQHWRDEWTAIPYLYCDRLQEVAGPEVGQAQFSWKYGEGLRPGETQYGPVGSLPFIAGWYVRVVWTDPETLHAVRWYGRILDDADERDGAYLRGGAKVPAGVQRLIAFDLKHELARVQIRRSIVAGPAGSPSDVTFLPRVIPFNRGATGNSAGVGNATAAEEPPGLTKRFAREFLDFESEFLHSAWSAYDLLKYLLYWFTPGDRDDVATIPFQPDVETHLDALDWFSPEFDPAGMSLLDCLEMIIPRRRGLVWRLRVEERNAPEVDVVRVGVFPVATETIALPGGGELPANLFRHAIDVDAAASVLDLTVRESAAALYQQVVVRGERRRAVCTLSFRDVDEDPEKDAELEPYWYSADEALYQDPSAAIAGYDELGHVEQVERKRAFRSGDRLRAVYARFGIPDNSWAARTGDGQGGRNGSGGGLLPPFPVLAADGQPAVFDPAPFWRPGLRFEASLPLLPGVDYATGGNDINRAALAAVGAAPDWRPTFALLPIEKEGEIEEWRYRFVDQLAEPTEETGDGGRTWACAVRVLEGTATFEVRVNQPGMQHKIALDHFTAADDAEDGEPELDYEDLIATVCLVGDDHAEVRHPPDANLPAPPAEIRTLYLDVPGARLDWMVLGTVVDVDADGKPVRAAGGYWLLDDRPRLADLARLAWVWYGRRRRACHLEFRGLSSRFAIGHLLTTVGANETLQTLDTPITSIEWDFTTGTTRVRTDFGELDVSAFF